MASLTHAHTADLTKSSLEGIRMLLDDAFEDGFTEEDWEHALGGLHVLARDDGELVGHASVVQRRLAVDGRGIRTGYVEAVAVRSDRRGRGLGNDVMAEVEEIVRTAYDLGALSAGDRAARLYARRGWSRWDGPTWVLAPGGPMRTKDEDGGVYVLPTPTSPHLELTHPIACDWRPGDVW